MILPILVKTYREKNRIGLRTLAKEMKVNFHALRRWELGHEIEGRHWVKIVLWLLTE